MLIKRIACFVTKIAPECSAADAKLSRGSGAISAMSDNGFPYSITENRTNFMENIDHA